MLISPQLQALYNRNDCGSQEIYLVLVCLVWEGDLQYKYGIADLRAALLPHEYNKDRCEARLSHANIIVNIWSWAKQDNATAIINLYSTLLSGELSPIKSYTLLNNYGSLETDVWEVRTVKY